MSSENNRYRLAQSQRAPMAGAKLVGPADPSEKIEVTVYLRRGSKADLSPEVAQLGSLSPRQRKYLSREEFVRTHGPGRPRQGTSIRL
jgi:kumamolisin